MARAVPPPAEGAQPGGDHPRCPRCGSGDLLSIEVSRQQGAARQAAYCAGLYDRDRRRFVRRSCGYAGLLPEDGATVPAEAS